ncbi:MAG: hypothetical protein NC299_16875 [Lachnospiraceae bacterium]|nr:hypothetical protein [Ruminococcus sp.]MCM1277005.1 hypothetical protein [Lachnospiraceae bacterium]
MVSKEGVGNPLSGKEIRNIYRNEFYSADDPNYFNRDYNKVLFVNLFDAMESFKQRAEYIGKSKFTLEEIQEILTDAAEEI